VLTDEEGLDDVDDGAESERMESDLSLDGLVER